MLLLMQRAILICALLDTGSSFSVGHREDPRWPPYDNDIEEHDEGEEGAPGRPTSGLDVPPPSGQRENEVQIIITFQDALITAGQRGAG